MCTRSVVWTDGSESLLNTKLFLLRVPQDSLPLVVSKARLRDATILKPASGHMMNDGFEQSKVLGGCMETYETRCGGEKREWSIG
jgi:hypothetical protein